MAFFVSFAFGIIAGIIFMFSLRLFMKKRKEARRKRSASVAALRLATFDDLKRIMVSYVEGIIVNDTSAGAGKKNVKGKKKGTGHELIPTWISFQESERVAWLNAVLKELWPKINKATSSVIRETVEPMLEEMKPAGVKSLRFQTLTLGDVSPMIEGIRVHKLPPNSKHHQLMLDLDFKFGGNPKIILCIDTVTLDMPVGVKDLQFFATIRLIFSFCDDLPCIGAIGVSILKKPKPIIRYKLKAAGGNISKIVQRVVDGIIDSSLEAYIWPERVVVPLVGNFDCTHMENSINGLLTVRVVRANSLRNVDTFGKSDPFVLLWTRPVQKFKTAVKDNDLNPVWNEIFELEVDDTHESRLVLHVLDDDPMSQDSLGWATIDLSQCHVDKPDWQSLTVHLLKSLDDSRHKDDLTYGTISVELKLHWYDEAEKGEATKREKERLEKAANNKKGAAAAALSSGTFAAKGGAQLVAAGAKGGVTVVAAGAGAVVQVTSQTVTEFGGVVTDLGSSTLLMGSDVAKGSTSGGSRVVHGASKVIGGAGKLVASSFSSVSNVYGNLTRRSKGGKEDAPPSPSS